MYARDEEEGGGVGMRRNEEEGAQIQSYSKLRVHSYSSELSPTWTRSYSQTLIDRRSLWQIINMRCTYGELHAVSIFVFFPAGSQKVKGPAARSLWGTTRYRYRYPPDLSWGAF